MLKLFGIDTNIRQATAHKAVEMFFEFTVVLFPGAIARSRCNFLAMANNFKLTKINGGTNMTVKIIKNIGKDMTPYLEIIYTTADGISNITRKVSSLRLVTDV